jgi:spermidine/putrescine transport system ATP-binding protein
MVESVLTSERSSDTVIALERVNKQFGSVMAVDNVELDIQRGEFISLLGPSGCGKTTTLRMIAGFETPTSGRILVDGKDVVEIPPYRRHVNMVFQQYALFPHMNVFDNVAFGPRSQHVESSEIGPRVTEMLKAVHLEGFEKRRPNQLSGGQQQRVALARALVNYPSALLLDEPLGALDLKLRRAMQLELKRIQRDVGITFVYVTHDQEEALTMSDRVVVMNEGKVQQIGPPEEIYARPISPFVAGFIGVANLLPAKVKQVDGREMLLSFDAAGWTTASVEGRNFKPDEAVLVVLRPERLSISLSPPADHATGRVQARVMDIVFQGPVIRIDLQTLNEHQLVVLLMAHDRPSRIEPGDKVWVTWEPATAYGLALTGENQ